MPRVIDASILFLCFWVSGNKLFKLYSLYGIEKMGAKKVWKSCFSDFGLNFPYILESLFFYLFSRLNAFMEKEKLDGEIIVDYCNTAMDSLVENSMYVNKVWVQCENESCLKWRLLSNEDAAKVDHSKPWYCFMNTDSRYNKCSISEEDFPEESQLHESGFKIVYSQLPLGSLVLVKLQNWPR